MHILGISAFYHDSAAALIEDRHILAAAQEERFTRRKHDPSFPHNAVTFCLNQAGVAIDELDAVVFYDKPFLKFERLLETYYAFAPKGLRSFLSAIPVWIKEKVMLKKLILDELHKIEAFDKKKITLLFPEHHLSHAASAFFPSPFDESAILTIDGVGEWATTSICHGQGNNITLFRELKFPHSVGLLYSAFTYYLGFKVNSGEYKLMGLAPYGNPAASRTTKFMDIIKQDLVDIKEDGSINLNQDFFDYATGLRMAKDARWAELFGFPVREQEGDLLPEHCDLALAIQKVSEEIILKMARETKRLTGSKHLCLAGGVALNCVANGKLIREGLFDDIWIQPAAGDAGGALGAAYAAYHIYFNKERNGSSGTDIMEGSYLGPRFTDDDITLAAKKRKAVYTYFSDFDALCVKTAEIIDQGNVVGWFQDRMEWGSQGARQQEHHRRCKEPGNAEETQPEDKIQGGIPPLRAFGPHRGLRRVFRHRCTVSIYASRGGCK